MRLILFLILLSLVACSSDPPPSPRNRRNNRVGTTARERTPPEPRGEDATQPDPTQETTTPTPGTNRFTLPVQVVGDNNIQMDIRTEENNTKVVIKTTSASQVFNILAGFDGQVSSENPRRIILTDGSQELIFDLDEDVSLNAPRTSVTEGEILASTTGSITFSLRKNGKPIRFCLNIINQSEGLVNINRENDEGQCD